MDLYLRVLELDPLNTRANERLGKIADLWANAAETNLSRGKVDLAKRMIEKGLQAQPGNPHLKALLQRANETEG